MNSVRALSFIFILLTAAASAQVLQPATISVTSSFTNPAGAVKSRLEHPNGPGIHAVTVAGNTTETSPRTATASVPSSLTDTSATVPLTVDAAGSPQWRVGSTLRLSGYGEDFYFGPSGNISTVPGGGYVHTFSGVVSIVDITFSASVSGGTITVTTTDGTRSLAQLSLPAGNRAEVVVPGGEPLVIRLAVETGSGGTAGTLRRVIRTINTWSGAGGVPADTIQAMNLNISEAATLGALTGTFDVAGELELAGATRVVAAYFSHNFPGYGGWTRTFDVPGDPASGNFTLGNLSSSASIAANDPGANSGYGVQGTAFLKNQLPSGNRAVQYIRTKMLFSPDVPAVPGGGTASMGSAFAMSSGSIRGTIQLLGPEPEPGITPVLHRIVTNADNDASGDGVPDGGGDPYAWLNGSAIVSRTHPDTSSYGGAAQMVLERTVTGSAVNCEYELICPSPLSGPAVAWTEPSAYLLMANGTITEAEYFNTRYDMRRSTAATLSLSPGTIGSQSYSVEMGEVTLIVRSASPAVNIWQPQLQWHPNPGGLTGAPANNMVVEGISAYGWPTSAAAAAQRGSLRTVLPAGTYTVRPTVNTVSASGPGVTTLAPFTIVVPPRGRVTADNGLSLTAVVPHCLGPLSIGMLYGGVLSNGAAVTSIQYRVDGGPLQNATFTPGADPLFSLPYPVGLSAGTHTITITAATSDGRTASFSQPFTWDDTPPVIAPMENITVDGATAAGGYVNFSAPLFTDDCAAGLIYSTPSSGSFFLTGTTTVTWTAYDGAGNLATSTFTVTVVPPCPPPVRSHFYDPAAQNHFQYPDKPSWHNSPSMSVEAWVKREDDSRIETIISQDYIQSFWFGFAGKKLRFYRSGGFSADSAGDVYDGAWTHVAVSYDGETAIFYINGQPAGTSALFNTGTGNADPVVIGGDFTEGGFNYGFHGRLDEIRLHNRALGAVEITNSPRSQYRTGWELSATFGSGGSVEDLSGALPSASTLPPQPQIEGILPKWINVPRTLNTINMDGTVDLVTEYNAADLMVIRYDAGAAGIRDALAYWTYRDEPGDRALYIGVRGVREVVAPWTRAQSFLSVYVDSARNVFPPAFAGPGQFRFNSRALDGTLSAGIPAAAQFQRGDSAGNYANLAPGDRLLSAPSPFGLIGAGGDSAEFRFEISTLTRDWSKDLRMAVAHHWISTVGDDAIGPVDADWLEPFTWTPVVFNGAPPELRHQRMGSQLFLRWQDAGCGRYTLERSSTLLPGSWTPLAAPVIHELDDGLLRSAIVDINSAPRDFFRLRR